MRAVMTLRLPELYLDFLDYVAGSDLDKSIISDIIKSVAQECKDMAFLWLVAKLLKCLGPITKMSMI